MPASVLPSQTKAKQLKALHEPRELFVLPNIWSPLGALLLERLGYKAAATASAAISTNNGYHDGEKMPYETHLAVLKDIAQAVNIPVSADWESGYATDNKLLAENVKKLLDTGIVGLNIEETRHDTRALFNLEEQSERIRVIRETADKAGIHLFINARTDVYLRPNLYSPEQMLAETIDRGNAYKDVGADCFYPIVLSKLEDIKTVVKEVDLPLNVLLMSSTPDFQTLKTVGVTRVTVGPGLLKLAIKTMKEAAENLLELNGAEAFKNNPITGDYLEDLIP